MRSWCFQQIFVQDNCLQLNFKEEFIFFNKSFFFLLVVQTKYKKMYPTVTKRNFFRKIFVTKVPWKNCTVMRGGDYFYTVWTNHIHHTPPPHIAGRRGVSGVRGGGSRPHCLLIVSPHSASCLLLGLACKMWGGGGVIDTVL